MIFAGKINKQFNQKAFYPFKDKGIDIIGLDKNNNLCFYQLKARNINQKFGEYWFQVEEEKLKRFEKVTRGKKSFWVLCALKEKEQFAFFKVPIGIVIRWYDEAKKNYKQKKKLFLHIKPLEDGTYIIAPERVAKKINIMRYLLK